MQLNLPARFTGNDAQQHMFTTIPLETEKMGFLLVDCNGDCGKECNQVIEQTISPALAAIRNAGIKAIYLYNEPLPDGRQSMEQEIHRLRRGQPPSEVPWRSSAPVWSASIRPNPDEPIIGKCAQSGFVNTFLDRYLRSWGIDTLITVGFSFKSCLFYTMIDAFHLNYRVIFLRDATNPPGTNEFVDTINPELPEQGWVRLVLTRLIEDHLGYTSTTNELITSIKKRI
jgi:nicotinamidase-related amidase